MIPSTDQASRTARHEGRSPAGPVLALFLTALAMRVLYVLTVIGTRAAPTSDSLDYDQIAWNLARGAGFSLGIGGDVYATAYRPPLVPWITSLLYHTVGHHFLGALLLQCLIGALVPVLLLSLGAALYGGGVGRLAGWMAAFHPLLIHFSGYLLSETTFCATLLAALIASAEWVKTPRPGRALGAGMLWGVATLARPPALLMPAIIAAWGWGPLGLTVRAGDRLRQLAFLALGCALVVGPWTLRNAVVLHAFVPVTTAGGRALLDSNNDTVWNDPAMRGGAITVYGIEPYASRVRGKGEVEADAISASLATAFLREHVREWPAMAAAKLARFWRLRTEGGRTEVWQRAGSPLRALGGTLDLMLIWSLVSFTLAAWGLVRSLQGARRWFQAIPAIVILYFMLNAVVFWGALRTRMPAEPSIVLLAALGFEDARRRWRTRSSGLRVLSGHGAP